MQSCNKTNTVHQGRENHLLSNLSTGARHNCLHQAYNILTGPICSVTPNTDLKQDAKNPCRTTVVHVCHEAKTSGAPLLWRQE